MGFCPLGSCTDSFTVMHFSMKCQRTDAEHSTQRVAWYASALPVYDLNQLFSCIYHVAFICDSYIPLSNECFINILTLLWTAILLNRPLKVKDHEKNTSIHITSSMWFILTIWLGDIVQKIQLSEYTVTLIRPLKVIKGQRSLKRKYIIHWFPLSFYVSLLSYRKKPQLI